LRSKKFTLTIRLGILVGVRHGGQIRVGATVGGRRLQLGAHLGDIGDLLAIGITQTYGGLQVVTGVEANGAGIILADAAQPGAGITPETGIGILPELGAEVYVAEICTATGVAKVGAGVVDNIRIF